MTSFRTTLLEERLNTAKLLRRAELLGVLFDQSKLYPTLDQTKSVGRTSSNMGGQTVAIASHRYREVTGSNPVKSLILQASLRNC